MGDLSEHFNKREFQCACGCGFNSIDMQLVALLEEMRSLLGRPIVVNCGCRCLKHNKDVGGEPNSAHLRGKAVDIKAETSTYRFALLALTYRRFKRIGIYNNFIHVDVDESLPQCVTWVTTKGGE